MGCLPIIIVVIAIAWLFGQCGNSSKDNEYAAITSAKMAVEDRLKSPSTAKFSSVKASKNYDGSWNVTGDVDAQNSFGAMMRNSFSVKVKLSNDGSSYSIISCSIY